MVSNWFGLGFMTLNSKLLKITILLSGHYLKIIARTWKWNVIHNYVKTSLVRSKTVQKVLMYHAFSKTSPFGMQQQILTVLRAVMTSGSTDVRGRCSFTVITCDAWRNGQKSEKSVNQHYSWPMVPKLGFCASGKKSGILFSFHAWDYEVAKSIFSVTVKPFLYWLSYVDSV